MINKNELRIGNLVNYFEDDTIFEVIGIDELGISVRNDEETTWIEYDCFEPIRLTDKWYGLLGFEEGATGYFRKNDMVITSEGQVYYGDDEVWISEEYQVHRLQNLYFELENEELRLPQNNEIFATSIKNSWSRDEVIKLIIKGHDIARENFHPENSYEESIDILNNWIKESLK